MRPYFSNVLLTLGTLLGVFSTLAHALGSTCSTPLTKGSAGPNDPFWMENIQHQGNIVVKAYDQSI